MKYQSIYKAIQKINYTYLNDWSDQAHDLWLILEVPSLHKRIWITNEFNHRLKISTANLDYNVDSREYHESYKHYQFKGIKQMRDFIIRNFTEKGSEK